MNKIIFTNISRQILDDCVDLYIDTFSKEPWNDTYDSREQVVEFFNNHLNNNYFFGYAALLQEKVVAVSLGFKKPWINGVEYYIDEFCVSYDKQGKGIGSWFLKEIEKEIKDQGMNAMILNTERNYPSFDFFTKNGFHELGGLLVLGK